MKTIEAEAVSSAPPSAVWAQLADVSKWTEWGSWSKVEVEGGGEHGPGAIRVLDRWPYHLRERVTDWVPNERMGYELVDGMKLEGYRATITLEPTPDGGTRIHWRSQYDRGGLLSGLAVRMAVPDAAKRVARAASR
jgi:uncharacterized protein YndB with AHSA1/START domain